MRSQNHLGEFEELVVLAILKLGPDAYGAAILDAFQDAGRSIAIGALYTTLSRLEDKGLIRSRLANPTKERGGKAKKYFKVLGAGERALQEAHTLRMKFAPQEAFAVRG